MNTQADANAPRRPYIFVERPRCPLCGSDHIKAYKTLQNSDGSATRYTTCKDCFARFFVVVE